MKIPVIKSKRLDDEFDAIAVALTHSLKGLSFLIHKNNFLVLHLVLGLIKRRTGY